MELGVLFDLQATHSFIDIAFMVKLDLHAWSLGRPIVYLLLYDRFYLNWVCRKYKLTFDEEESVYLVNLICLPMCEFDLILGMDMLEITEQ